MALLVHILGTPHHHVFIYTIGGWTLYYNTMSIFKPFVSTLNLYLCTMARVEYRAPPAYQGCLPTTVPQPLGVKWKVLLASWRAPCITPPSPRFTCPHAIHLSTRTIMAVSTKAVWSGVKLVPAESHHTKVCL